MSKLTLGQAEAILEIDTFLDALVNLPMVDFIQEYYEDWKNLIEEADKIVNDDE